MSPAAGPGTVPRVPRWPQSPQPAAVTPFSDLGVKLPPGSGAVPSARPLVALTGPAAAAVGPASCCEEQSSAF